MMSPMLTISLTEPILPTSTLVVVDPHDDTLIHAHGACTELAELVDLVERWTDAGVDDPDAFDAALFGLGLALPLSATAGLKPCPECWGN